MKYSSCSIVAFPDEIISKFLVLIYLIFSSFCWNFSFNLQSISIPKSEFNLVWVAPILSRFQRNSGYLSLIFLLLPAGLSLRRSRSSIPSFSFLQTANTQFMLSKYLSMRKSLISSLNCANSWNCSIYLRRSCGLTRWFAANFTKCFLKNFKGF